MSIFASKDEIEAFTGSRTREAQALWLKKHKILFFRNVKGAVILAKSLLGDSPRSKTKSGDKFDQLLKLRSTLSKHSFDRRSTGVYLLKKGDAVVYVGQTTNFLSRAGDHVGNKKYDFDTIDFVPLPKSQLDIYEQELIARLCPIYNINHNNFAEPAVRI